MLPRPNPLVLLAAYALVMGMTPGAALAQQFDPEVDYLNEIEEVVVTARRREGGGGGRRTAASRQDLERSDQTDMAGFFDDIDGLSTLGADAEGNAFSIGGLSADLGNVTLNGQGMGEGRGSGGFSASDLPPDMIRRVDVLKIPTAAMEEGGSAGSVNLQLRNPVTIAGHSISAKGRLGYVPDDGIFNPSASFFAGGPSENRVFGYMFNATLSDRTREYASQDISRWIDGEFDGVTAYYPGQVRNNEAKDKTEEGFAGLTLGFRPHESLDISGNLFLSRKDRSIVNHGVQYRFEKQRDITAVEIDGRIVSELESNDRSRDNLRITGSTRDDRVDSVVLGINAAWRPADWRVSAALGYGNDDNESKAPSQSVSFAANSPFGYQARADGGLVARDANEFDPVSAFELGRINLSDRITEDKNAYASFDAVRLLSDGFFRRVRFGLKSRESARERTQSRGRVQSEVGLTLEDFFDEEYRRTQWDATAWPASDLGAVDSFVGDSEIEWEDNRLNDYDMDRRTNAAYVQLDFRAERGDQRLLVGNLGFRAVDTRTSIKGFREEDGALRPFSQVDDYTDYLPSAIVRARVADRTVLTLGAARVMTHPAFNDLAPGIRVNYGERTARSGNPDLEPFRANQYLSELTWAANGRRVTANLTWRDVDTYFVLGEESLEIDDDVFLLTRPVNGEDGSILTAGLSVEQNLARLTRSLRGWSAALSYIHNHSRTEMKDPYTGETLPMPRTAEHVLRADLVYSRQVFSGKLSYQRRGESLKAPVSESGLSVWNRPVGNLNLNLGWNLDNGLRINLDGRNLLAEEQVQTTDVSYQVWRITERDRTVAATVQAKW